MLQQLPKTQAFTKLNPLYLQCTHTRSPPPPSADWIHPYAVEVVNISYTDPMVTAPLHITPFARPEDTPFVYVSDLQALISCARDLEASTLVAIDLEHHAQRSFLGIVCLMQLSTPKCDYIIDTLDLHDSMHVLLPAFTNPGIVKVLHGADHDVKWLQRDFGLFIVNMFDTFR